MPATPKVAGVELTLLDCVRYFHKATGIDGVGRHSSGYWRQGRASRARECRHVVRELVRYAGSAIHSIGQGMLGKPRRSSRSSKKAKTFVPLDPAVKPLIESLADSYEKDVEWRLVLNEPVEIDF